MAPLVAEALENFVPVHINVGGVTYTTCLDTLTRFPDSKIAKLFNGSIPIGVDPNPIQQQYFLDRDGQTFRHVLNFLRYSKLVLPNNFTELDLLLEEALYYEIEDLCRALREECSVQSDSGSDEQTELSGDDCGEKPKARKKKRSKKTGNKGKLKVGHDGDELANIGESNQGKDGELAGTNKLLKNFPCLSELIIVRTDILGVVEKLVCSDKHFEIQLPTSPPLAQLVEVKKSVGQLCNELTFITNVQCRNCSKYPIKVFEFYKAYITKDGKHTCNNCNPSYNHIMRTFNCDVKDVAWYPSKVKIDFPWIAKCLMRHGYKLVTSTGWAYSEGGGAIYHHFVK